MLKSLLIFYLRIKAKGLDVYLLRHFPGDWNKIYRRQSVLVRQQPRNVKVKSVAIVKEKFAKSFTKICFEELSVLLT